MKISRKALSLLPLILLIFTFLISCVTGCTQKNSTTFTSDKKNISVDQEKTEIALQTSDGKIYRDTQKLENKLKELKKESDQLVWCTISAGTDDDVLLPGDNVKSANTLLKNKTGLNLNVLYITDENYDNKVYSSNLKRFLKKGYVDIFFSGDSYDRKADLKIYNSFIQDGYAEKLNSYLKTNTKLRNCFRKCEWSALERDGNIYAVPNQYFTTHRFYAAFSKKDFKEAGALSLDKLSSSLEYLMQKCKSDKKGDLKKSIIWSLNYYDMLNSMGILDSGGLWYSHEDGRVTTALDSSEVKDVLAELRFLYKKGFFVNKKINMDESYILDKKIIRGKFSAAFFNNEAFIDPLKKNYYIKPIDYYYNGEWFQNTMINAMGGKKNEAVEAVTAMLTYKDFSMHFIYGKAGSDYVIKNGYAYLPDGKELPRRWFKSAFGVCDNLCTAKFNECYGKDAKNYKRKYFSDKSMSVSILNGFVPVPYSVKDKYATSNVFNRLLESDDFEKDYYRNEKELKKKGEKRVLKAQNSVNEFIREK